MFVRNLANKLEGWNTISDISNKLNVKKSTAYVYAHKLDEKGFVLKKVKKPRGTMYLINPIPRSSEHPGMLKGTDIVTSEIEFSNKEIFPEHRIAYFLQKAKKEKNPRYRKEANNIIRSISNWKRLYRYLKAYNVIEDFKKLYIKARKNISKVPSIPKRYQKLIGV